MKKYYIGLDGGGTKTKCVVTDQILNVLYECIGGPSNFLVYGIEEVSNTLFNLLEESCKNLGIQFEDIESVVLGSAGAGRKNDAEKLKKDFQNLLVEKNKKLNSFNIESDARIALEGAFRGKPGSILIAGTGSIMFGKNKDGELLRVGGFGRYIGDEGSGNSLGKMGLAAVAKVFDGRSEHSKLVDIVKKELNISDTSELITEIYSNNFPLADAAPLVIKAAAEGDKTCMEILEKNIEELLLHIKAMYSKLKEPTMRLSLIGGTIATDNLYANQFKLRVKEKFPKVKIEKAELPPDLGAALMAINAE